MKTYAFAAVVAFVAGAFAQVHYNPDGSYTCPSRGGNYCAGKSGTTNIIIRCEGTVGYPGNCDDNLAGEPPLGVSYAPCVETSRRSGDAACSKNGVVYPDPPASYTTTPRAYTPTGGRPTMRPTVIPPYPITYPHRNHSTTTVTIPPPPHSYTSTTTKLTSTSSSQSSATTYTTSITKYYTVTAATTYTVTESECAASTHVPARGPKTITITESTSVYTTSYPITTTYGPGSTSTYYTTTVYTTVVPCPPTTTTIYPYTTPSTHSKHRTVLTTTTTSTSTSSIHTHTIHPTGGHSGHGNHTTSTWKLSAPAYSNTLTTPSSYPSEVTYRPRAIRRSVPEDQAPRSYEGAAASLSAKTASLSGVAALVLVVSFMVAA